MSQNNVIGRVLSVDNFRVYIKIEDNNLLYNPLYNKLSSSYLLTLLY